LFFEKPEIFASFGGAIVPNPRAHGVCYARGFGEPYQIYHGLSFFFLQNAKHSYVSSSFFLERRKKNAKSILKRTFNRKIIKYTQTSFLNQIPY
ncbi:MAG: hypothetical protein IJV70_02505, partial [Clostridia bacterium]|nr:hypothetical protein [Clostridia bacterium]